MNKKLNLLIILCALVTVLTLAFLGYQVLTGQHEADNLMTQPSEDRNYATDFTVYDGDGNPHKLSDFRGKPVVLNFWASWCGPCKSEMPAFQEAYETYGQEVTFVMVNLTDGYQETQASAQSYVSGAGYSFPVYFDTAMSAAIAYNVTGVPATYFIDAEGCLVSSAQGALSADALNQGIAMITG